MFENFSQIYVFLANLSFGIIAGILYYPLFLINFTKKLYFLRWLFDFLFFLIITIFYFLYAYFFKFPNFRIFEVFALCLGGVCGFKSFKITLAKRIKK